MIHGCLRVPELFTLVCEALQQEWETEEYGRSPTLAVLARTCRDFLGPSLDVLWREVSGLQPLLCTMPCDLFEMKEKGPAVHKENILCLRRAILPSDLTNIPSYAKRIRKIRMFSRFPVDIGVTQALSLATLHMRPLLPNIEHLSWDYGLSSIEAERSMLHVIPLFLAPKLISLSFVLANVSDTISLSVLSGLVNFCPALKNLTFSIENFNEEHRRTISSAICQWRGLQSVRITDLTREALEHLATIPTLQTLSFNSLSGATRTYDERLSIIICDRARGYPALRFLSISCRTMEMAIAFVQLLSSSPVEELKISVMDRCYPPAWRELFRTISRHLNATSLKQLILMDILLDWQSVHSEIELDALTVFSNLRNVNVQPGLGMMLTSDTANRLAAAWPHIEHLQLGTACPPSKTIITPRDLIPFARYCPNLQFLGIVFDARSVHLRSLNPDGGPFSNNLTSLSVGDSPIDDPNLVAAFLSSIFPTISSVSATCEDDIADEMWIEVERMLEMFE